MTDTVTVGMANLTEMVVHEFKEAFQKNQYGIKAKPEAERPKDPFVQMVMPDFSQSDEALRLRYAVPAGQSLAASALEMGASLSDFSIVCTEDGPPTMPLVFKFFTGAVR